MPWMNLAQLLSQLRRTGVDPSEIVVLVDQRDLEKIPRSLMEESGPDTAGDDDNLDDDDY